MIGVVLALLVLLVCSSLFYLAWKLYESEVSCGLKYEATRILYNNLGRYTKIYELADDELDDAINVLTEYKKTWIRRVPSLNMRIAYRHRINELISEVKAKKLTNEVKGILPSIETE